MDTVSRHTLTGTRRFVRTNFWAREARAGGDLYEEHLRPDDDELNSAAEFIQVTTLRMRRHARVSIRILLNRVCLYSPSQRPPLLHFFKNCAQK